MPFHGEKNFKTSTSNCHPIIDFIMNQDFSLRCNEHKKQVIWDKKTHKFVGYCDFDGEVSLESSEMLFCKC
ncbi:THAP-type domain-containing protein [Aphis craccivora]|uniref:THAP-type domain-containing protein n=1 Tax=Aphis craccivora TaxID=307492 RepID=A0A6G0VY15_APHCR|nr:THAP-type domain-containing protein [Aphis craccivora]